MFVKWKIGDGITQRRCG